MPAAFTTLIHFAISFRMLAENSFALSPSGSSPSRRKNSLTSGKWTIFDLPVRGTEIRHIALDERDGRTQVVVPVYRTNQMGVMTVRSEAELAALKAQAQR